MVMNQKPVDLWHKTAAILAGRSVVIRWRRPCVANTRGMAYIDDHDNQAYIDVAPDLGKADQFLVYLHELAHLALSHVRPSGWAREQSLAIKSPLVVEYSKRQTEREAAADKLAEEWVNFAAARLHYYRGDPYTQALQALAGWNEYQAIIDRAVKRAIEKLDLK